MALFSAAAITADTKGLSIFDLLNSYLRFDVWMGLVIRQFKVLIPKRKNISHSRVDLHRRQRLRLAAQLQLHLFKVIAIQVGVSKCVDKIRGFHVTYLGYHHCEQCIRGNVEGYPEKNIRTALIQLAGKLRLEQSAFRISRCYIKLKKGMTRWQCHV